MRIVRLDHVQLAMPAGGEGLARAFYGGALGIPEVPKPPELAKRGGCWFERGELKIHLGVEREFHPARKAHPGLQVEDLPLRHCGALSPHARAVNDSCVRGLTRR